MVTLRCFSLFLTFTALTSAGFAQQLQQFSISFVCLGTCCLECLRNTNLSQIDDRAKWTILQTHTKDVESCNEVQCTIEYVDHRSEYNNLQTLWKSIAVFSVETGTIGLTLDLEQRGGIQRIEVHGRKLTTPELRISSDGVNFDMVEIIAYNETAHKLSIKPSLEVPHARYLHLLFSGVELPEISEILVFQFQESCGFCIVHLTKELTYLADQIDLLQMFGVNHQFGLLQANLQDFVESIGKLETSVPILQNLLEGKTPLQITLLETVILQIFEELHDFSDDLQYLLVAAVANQDDICELKDEVYSVSSGLNSQLIDTMTGTTEAQAISASIDERRYTAVQTEILMHKITSEKDSSIAEAFLEAEKVINTVVIIIFDMLKKSAIKSLGLTIISVQVMTTDSFNNTLVVDAALEENNRLNESIDLMFFTYDSLLADSKHLLIAGQTLLNDTVPLENIHSPLKDILFLASLLDASIGEYRLGINMCIPAEVCTLGDLYAGSIYQNSSSILNISAFTFKRGITFINATSELFNYTDLNVFALLVQDVIFAVDDQLENIGVSVLSANSSTLQEKYNQNLQPLLTILNNSGVHLMLLLPREKHNVFIILFDELHFFAANNTCLLDELLMKTDAVDLRENLLQVHLDADNARNTTEVSINLVLSIENLAIGRFINDTVSNTEKASISLDTSLFNLETTQLLVNTTKSSVDSFSANVSEFIAENNRIIKEINQIIASLQDVHARINTINSPILFSGEELESSYVSLQPPPYKTVNDTIQFESIDIYYWTGPEFRTPAILFYSGPICSVDNNEHNSDDYIIILLESERKIDVHWRVDNETGSGSWDGFQLGFSQLHITRIGASVAIRYGVSVGQLGNPITFGTISNGLFTTSSRTSFYLGGLPQGSMLDCSLQVIQSDIYASFNGQIQQLLYNGEQWGLWNIRSASDTTFYGEFQRNELATVNAWHASQTSTASAISFDGVGYLYVERLGSSSPFRLMRITLRPNDESNGLVLYAYESMINLSMEIYFQLGKLKLLLTRHDNNITLINYVQELDSNIISGTSRTLEIIFAKNVGFQVNGRNFIDTNNAVFFSDLTNVKAWFGGFNEDAFETNDMFTPTGTRTGYFGCMDIAIEDEISSSYVFEGDHFINYYLNSPVQQGFSATCLKTVYANEVGFDGTPNSFLKYNYLNTVMPPNTPVDFEHTASSTISFSFYPERSEGIILVLQNQDDDELFVVIHNSFLEVTISLTSTGKRSTLISGVMVTLKEWHNVLIQFRDDHYEFYVNGVMQSSSETMSEFNFQGLLSPPESDTSPPIFFVGGIDDTVMTSVNASLPSFTGCMKDLTYGYGALSFLNRAQALPRYPPGVTYYSCPFVTSENFHPVLSVHPDPPMPNLCVPSPSIRNTSHGSFHKLTQLNTSNIIGLLRRSWSFEVAIQYKDNGHVLSIVTMEDYMISLIIQNRLPVLVLTGAAKQQIEGPELKENESVELAISCSKNSTGVSCFLIVNNSHSEIGTIETDTFVPQPPIVFGQAILSDRGKVDSFIGCINSISTNGDTNGFEDVYTGQECHTNIEQGIGFTGNSLLEKEVMLTENGSVTVSMTFKSVYANGLVMVLSRANKSETVFAAGLRNGRIQVSNTHGISEEIQVGVCHPNSSAFSTLEVKLQDELITVTSDNVSTTLPATITNELFTVSIGNAPENLTGKDHFSTDVLGDLSFLPGLIGCVMKVEINDVLYTDMNILSLDVTENILYGTCP